jgi:flagellar basal body rod protein FlgG
MACQQTNIDVIANNLANINTNGFKKSRVNFQDLMYQNIRTPGADTDWHGGKGGRCGKSFPPGGLFPNQESTRYGD